MKDYKETVIEELTSAYAANVISVDEYERRVEFVTEAKDEAAVRRMLDDLPKEVFQQPPIPGGKRAVGYQVNDGRVPPRGEIVALFSSVNRDGRWPVPRRLEASSIFGSANIDLRDSLIPREGVKIDAAAVFGSLSIIVPEGVNVRVKAVSIFGTASGTDTLADPAAPTLDIEAAAVFGSCDVKVLRRGARSDGA